MADTYSNVAFAITGCLAALVVMGHQHFRETSQFHVQESSSHYLWNARHLEIGQID